MYYIRQSADTKEEIMKRLISIAVILMTGLIVMSCTGMTTEQRKEETSLSASVGNAPFVGYTSPDVRTLNREYSGGQNK